MTRLQSAQEKNAKKGKVVMVIQGMYVLGSAVAIHVCDAKDVILDYSRPSTCTVYVFFDFFLFRCVFCRFAHLLLVDAI